MVSKRRNPVTDDQIIRAYGEIKSGNAVADQLGVSRPTVYAVLKKHGIDRTVYLDNVARHGVLDKQIVTLYHELKSATQVMERLGVSPKRFYNTLRRCGVDTYGHEYSKLGRRKFSEQDEEALRRLVSEGLSATEIARHYDTSTDVVLETLRRAGIQFELAKSRMSDEEKARAIALYESGMPFNKVAKEMGRTEATITNLVHRERPDLVRARFKRGAESPTWKGGRTVSHGYVYVLLDRDDPLIGMAAKDGRVAEHRLVMARSLGRALLPHETVHHKDGDTAHNNIENLQLRNGRHGNGTAMVCLDCGSHNVGHAELG